jgi:hypothetical protein
METLRAERPKSRAEKLAAVSEDRRKKNRAPGRRPYTREPPEGAKIIRIEQARSVLGGMTRNKVYELINRGELEVMRVDSATYIVVDSINKFIERGRGVPLRPMPTTPKRRGRKT